MLTSQSVDVSGVPAGGEARVGDAYRFTEHRMKREVWPTS